MRRTLPPSRTRRIAKWVGLVACVVILVTWAVSTLFRKVVEAIDGVEDTTIEIPYWLLLTLAAIPTAILWHRDRRTVKPGYCGVCGYDLRASKKKCPECGTPIAPRPR